MGKALAAWVRCLASTRDLVADAAAWLARITGQEADELLRRRTTMTSHDFEWFWNGLPMPADRTNPAAVCRVLLAESGAAESPERLADRLLEATAAGRTPNGAEAAASLAEIAAVGSLPTFLLTPPGQTGVGLWLATAGRLLGGLVAAAPSLAAAVAVEAADAEAVLHNGPPSHSLAVLRDGWVVIESLGEAELEERLQAAGVPAGPPSAVRRLVEDGMFEELAAAFTEAARLAGPKAVPEEEDEARSAAERFLFERLESLPATAGLFALNQRLDFHHGPALAEVDLLAARFRLVVELDGSYYHLRDSAAYRRDRRKDWELQRRGYLVLRFLSDDVVERLEEILDTILAAVELRRAPTPE